MPREKKGNVKMSFYLPEELEQRVDAYIIGHYKASEAYGVKSEFMSNAVSCYLNTCYAVENKKMTPDEVTIWKYQHQPIGTTSEEDKKDV